MPKEEDKSEKDPNEDKEAEDDIYDENEREEQLEEETIKPEEAGFIEGYESRDLFKCSTCGAPINPEDAVERAIKGKPWYFCSEECAVQSEEENEEGAG